MDDPKFNRAAFFRAIQARRPDAPLIGKDAGFSGYQRAAGNFLEGAAGTLTDIALEGPGIITEGIGGAMQELAKKGKLLSILDPAGKLVEEQGKLARAAAFVGRTLMEEATVEPDSRPAGGVQGFLTEDVATGAGSTLPFLGVGAAARVVGAPALSLLGGRSSWTYSRPRRAPWRTGPPSSEPPRPTRTPARWRSGPPSPRLRGWAPSRPFPWVRCSSG